MKKQQNFKWILINSVKFPISQQYTLTLLRIHNNKDVVGF